MTQGDSLTDTGTVERQLEHAHVAIERLSAMAQDLDQVVRQELRSAFAEEFQMLGAASERAAQALHAVRRAASIRVALWAIGVTVACSAIPLAVAWAALPSQAELARMSEERDELAASLARLREQGGKVDLRRCGTAGRLCVRVDRSSPAYGADADYLIVKGY
jgi:hypothetical protein